MEAIQTPITRWKEKTTRKRRNENFPASGKQNLTKEFKNNPKLLKNIEASNKTMYVINKPQTPHNTGQFLIKNFNVSNEFDEVDLNQEYFDTDMCRTGGSMKGKILINLDFLNNKRFNSEGAEMEPIYEFNPSEEM